MESRVSTLERAIEEMKEESRANFQRLGDRMEDVMRRLKNMEKGSEGSKDSLNGDRVGRREEVDEKWVEENRENQRGDPSLTKRMVTPTILLQEKEIEVVTLVWKMGTAELEKRCGEQNQLTTKQNTVLQEILGTFEGIFSTPQEIPRKRHFNDQIPIKAGIDPINVRPYRYPHLLKAVIDNQVAEMSQTGIIRASKSPYSTPVILVKKKDGNWLFCIDYQALNKAIFSDKFPIPRIELLLDELYGASYFSKVDLRAGYHQIRMEENDIPKTVFRAHQEHYEFLVMPLGLSNALATFQSITNTVLKEFLRKNVLVFFDDILVYSKTWEEHKEHLYQVLSTLGQQQLFANWKKRGFGKKQIRYLGVQMEPEKVLAGQDWPIPRSIKALRGFLGLMGYYRRFIKDYGKIARPLTDLSNKGELVWSAQCTEAMNILKTALTTTPLLALPDFMWNVMLQVGVLATPWDIKDEGTFRDQFLNFHLEDKVVRNPGNMDKTFKVYVRKKVQNK
ncbi:hypothetical protein V8G54_028861 [Vigna mungo]|uniref:Reverse transcriptase domain-containing protein n=1 Tax=Vigna mungo TaxID=3915 RepID=A0AAQ3MT72_VIGMU